MQNKATNKSWIQKKVSNLTRMAALHKFDIHTHILPAEIPDFKERFGYGGFIKYKQNDDRQREMIYDDGRFFRRIDANCWDPLVRIAEMDATNVKMQALSPVPVLFNYWAQGADALQTARFFNDHIAGLVKAHPDRFVALGTLPMQEPALAIQEMQRCALEHDFRGFEIGSHVEQWNLHDPRFDVIYTMAEQLDVALFVHPWGMHSDGRRTAFWLPWLVEMPAETAAAIACVLMGGVLQKHPKLRFCFAHGGGSYPFIKGRIEHGYNVRPDLCATHCDQAPSEFDGRFWTDSLVHSEQSLKLLLETVGERRVILGSDYPFPLGEHRPGELIEKYCVQDDPLKMDLLWKNAAEFLRLQ